jgi:hypothetical protein
VAYVIDLFLMPIFVVVAIVAFVKRRRFASSTPRLVWGSTPLINNVYWSLSMREGGFISDTYMFNRYSINNRNDFDNILTEEYRWCPLPLRPYLGFCITLMRYDVVFTSFTGFMLATPLLRKFQSGFFRLAGVKTVVIPFGGDAYVYSRIRSLETLQGLLFSYPQAARNQKRIAEDVDYWCARADVVISGLMGPDGIGRWDVPTPSPLSLDLTQWEPTTRRSKADGRNGVVVVAHAPNHRGFKGTEFVIEAVNQIRAEGFQVELRLIEGVKNEEVRQIFRDDVDILVEQLLFCGHGMNGLEGMASGLPVICNLEDEQILLPVRRWSFFGECPLVSANPETLVDVLRKLVAEPELRLELGQMGRDYVEKYHGLDSSRYLFSAVLDYLYGRRDSIANLYHPLTSEYVNRSPRIVPPLDKNRLRIG